MFLCFACIYVCFVCMYVYVCMYELKNCINLVRTLKVVSDYLRYVCMYTCFFCI
jgi:hypothetical protein